MEVRVPMEMNMGKFSEKLVGLLELAKKKKNVLEYQEISDYFKDQPLDAEQMDKIFDFLEASGVDVLRQRTVQMTLCWTMTWILMAWTMRKK